MPKHYDRSRRNDAVHPVHVHVHVLVHVLVQLLVLVLPLTEPSTRCCHGRQVRRVSRRRAMSPAWFTDRTDRTYRRRAESQNSVDARSLLYCALWPRCLDFKSHVSSARYSNDGRASKPEAHRRASIVRRPAATSRATVRLFINEMR